MIFNEKLLSISKNWVNLEDYQEIQKINKWCRFGFTYFPGSMFRAAQKTYKSMPPQDGQTLRMRKYE